MSFPIFRTLINDITPKKWYESRIPDRYVEIKNLIKEKIGESYAHIFCEPKISESAYDGKMEAIWFADDKMNGAVPISSLKNEDHKIAVDILNASIKKIIDFYTYFLNLLLHLELWV